MPKDSYSLKQHIEAILFWKGDPVSLASLAKITGSTKDEVKSGIDELREDLLNRGVILIEHEGEYTLGTNPESAKLIETVRTEELSKDLGRAGLETLAIVLYQGPIRRSEIDYIRGVNSNFILRNLLIRGLIERKSDPNDSRAAVYSPSIELLRFLGISRVADLKDFDTVKETILQFRSAEENESVSTAESVKAEGSINQTHNPNDHEHKNNEQIDKGESQPDDQANN